MLAILGINIFYWSVCYRIQEQMRGRNLMMKQISIETLKKLGRTISVRCQKLNLGPPAFQQVTSLKQAFYMKILRL